MTQRHVDHLIVGAGPVGLIAARLLGGSGRSCLVVERRDGPLRHPAAHVVNARSLEIFRQAGLDMAAIDAIAQDPADAGHVNFVTDLAGELIGRLPFERQGPDCLHLTPTPLRNISQHRLEPLLADAVAATAGVDLRYSHQWEQTVQDDDGATSTIVDLATGGRMEVRSRWVLAADGAASRVRKAMGIEMIGPPSLQSFITIHVRADLRHHVRDRPGVLHFVMDPKRSGCFVAHDLDSDWVFMHSFDPAQESEDEYDHHRCAGIVHDAIGAEHPHDDLVVQSVGSWHMSAQVAERMRHGRVFLMGDAAHRFPPTGGLGLNTGVADAHGLVWKLNAVDDGWAGASILDTYETERQPVAHKNCAQSTANAMKIFTLVEALGLTTDPTRRGLLDTLEDPAQQQAIEAAVDDQATHFDMLGLQLGYTYTEGALAGEGPSDGDLGRDGEAPEAKDDPRVFAPTGAVGERLPHAWIDNATSTLDLVDNAGLTLVTLGAHDRWAAGAAAAVVPLAHVRVGAHDNVPTNWCGLAGNGALVVRPDQHIAWRCVGTPTNPEAALAAAIDRTLGR